MIETVVREQMIDCLAAKLGIDPRASPAQGNRRRRAPVHDADGDDLRPDDRAATLEQAAETIDYDACGAAAGAAPTVDSLGWHQPLRGADRDVVPVGEHRRSDRPRQPDRRVDVLRVPRATARVSRRRSPKSSPTRPVSTLRRYASSKATPTRAVRSGDWREPERCHPGTAAPAAHEVRERIAAIAPTTRGVTGRHRDRRRLRMRGTPTKGVSIADVAQGAHRTSRCHRSAGRPEAQMRYVRYP
jgi:hypothetical protein